MSDTPKRWLSQLIPAWKRGTLAQRLEDSRVLLRVHGYLRASENDRIKARIRNEWKRESD